MVRCYLEVEDLNGVERALICNGIGPAKGTNMGSKAAWAITLPILTVARWVGILSLYQRAGDQHDLLYYVGGSWDDKRRADGIFLAECVSCAWTGPLWFVPVGLFLSFLFWLAVAVGGAGSFSFRDVPLNLSEVHEGLAKVL